MLYPKRAKKVTSRIKKNPYSFMNREIQYVTFIVYLNKHKIYNEKNLSYNLHFGYTISFRHCLQIE